MSRKLFLATLWKIRHLFRQSLPANSRFTILFNGIFTMNHSGPIVHDFRSSAVILKPEFRSRTDKTRHSKSDRGKFNCAYRDPESPPCLNPFHGLLDLLVEWDMVATPKAANGRERRETDLDIRHATKLPMLPPMMPERLLMVRCASDLGFDFDMILSRSGMQTLLSSELVQY